MFKRTFPRLNLEVSALGFGCMRLPVLEDKSIDEAEAIRMIRHAIDQGVTYIDTAYPYHSGMSEVLVGKALQDGYREKVVLATKLPCWRVEKYEDMMAILDEQLAKLQTDHVDFYLLHALDMNRYNKMKELGYQKFFDEAMAAGKIRFPSFSFHDNKEAFLQILNDYDWAMCQVQMNILDTGNQATIEGIQAAGTKGVGVVIMEPLRGGLMANPPETILARYARETVKRSPVEWAFRFLYTMPEVVTILSGMSTMEQVEDNLRIFSGDDAHELNDTEKKLYADIREAYLSIMKTRCTGCSYCQPCPRGVVIPDIFQSYDNHLLRQNEAKYPEHYTRFLENNTDASRCVKCGKCEAACPQHLPIIRYLAEIREVAVS